uniref:Uncharacterized protein n=1 Tax=Oryza punctata TaxID=4537 RepID=A0A0E0LIJ8_ORYPU
MRVSANNTHSEALDLTIVRGVLTTVMDDSILQSTKGPKTQQPKPISFHFPSLPSPSSSSSSSSRRRHPRNPRKP